MTVRVIVAALIVLAGLLPAVGRAQQDAAARVEALDKQMVELHRLGRFAEAIPLAAELMGLYEQALGPTHANVATAATNLALLYQRAGRYAEAEPLYRRALSIREQTLGPNHPDVVTTLNYLTELYRLQGTDVAAEPLLQRAITIKEQEAGPEHPDVALALDKLAQHYIARGRLDDALPLLQRSLAIREKAHGAEHVEVGAALASLAAVQLKLGRFADAEPSLKRSLAIAEAALGAEHPQVADRVAGLADAYAEQGRFADAEPLYRRALTIREAKLPPGDPAIGATLEALVATTSKLGMGGEAVPLLRRLLALKERALGADHRDLAPLLDTLADAEGPTAEAEPLLKRSLAIRERALGPDHREVADGLAHLGALTRTLGRAAEAEPLLRRSLAIREKLLGPDHPEVGTTLAELGATYAALRRGADAERAYTRSLTIAEAAYGPEHPRLAPILDGLAALARDQNKLEPALASSKRATALLDRRIVDDRSDAERRVTRAVFAHNAALVQATGGAEATAESFRIAQRAHAADLGGTAAMTARFAAGGDALAPLVKKRAGLADDWLVLDRRLADDAGKVNDARNRAEEDEARRFRGDIAREIAALDARIAKEFPAYAELVAPQPVTLAAAQALLTGDEALVAWLVGEDASWLWVLRRDRVAVHKLELGRAALSTEVMALRARLDPALNTGAQPFEATRAHALYQKILAPAAPLLETAAHVIVVPDGPLASLPLGVLVTRAPRADPAAPADHRAPAWFMLRHAISVLPSVGMLAAQRRTVRGTSSNTSFLGIGDPALDGKPDAARPVRLASLFRGALADVEAVRNLAPPPETGNELRAIAKALGGRDGDLMLGKRASEASLRRGGIEKHRVIAFVTLGLAAGDLTGAAEPALVLSPPDQASAEDDGLLTASEIATLKLGADWVVLSGTTSAADAIPDARGLAMLVKAFGHAGARSVLVAHWGVAPDTSARLIGAMVDATKQERTIGRAEALRRAELALLHPSSPPELAHPMAWAAFTLDGDGGQGR